MNPLRVLTDSLKYRTAKKELFEALKTRRPMGAELPNDPEVSTVVALLLKDKPELTIVRTDQSITLFFRDDLDPTLSPQTKAALDSAGMLITKDKVHRG